MTKSYRRAPRVTFEEVQEGEYLVRYMLFKSADVRHLFKKRARA